MAEQQTAKAGQATYRHKTEKREISVSWGAGYPPVDLKAQLGGADPADFDRDGDDPLAALEDVPAE